MSKRIRLSLSAQEKQSTDWSKCFICQEDKHEALKSPPMKIDLAKSGYRTLSKNISEFATGLAGKYQWREFPVVITGKYRPGKYSKF